MPSLSRSGLTQNIPGHRISGQASLDTTATVRKLKHQHSCYPEAWKLLALAQRIRVRTVLRARQASAKAPVRKQQILDHPLNHAPLLLLTGARKRRTTRTPRSARAKRNKDAKSCWAFLGVTVLGYGPLLQPSCKSEIALEDLRVPVCSHSRDFEARSLFPCSPVQGSTHPLRQVRLMQLAPNSSPGSHSPGASRSYESSGPCTLLSAIQSQQCLSLGPRGLFQLQRIAQDLSIWTGRSN